ncbi:MAG: hypothetical protein LUD17_13345 [Bacteroidales bacterium]|nr:hypothetical protein [Bacteroidales bacterium]
MDIKKTSIIALATAIGMSAYAQVGHRAAALDDDAWEVSQWISAVNAPVIKGKVYDFDRAADGAS